MKIVLSHPTSNSNVRAIANGFLDAGVLNTFYTSIALFNGSMLHNLSHLKPFLELKRRGFNMSLKEYVKIYPFYELMRLVAVKIGAKQLLAHETGTFSLEKCYQAFDKHVASCLCKKYNKNINAVYAYEDGALATFTKAKTLGIKCIYDLPIAYWETGRKLMHEEAKRLPQWAKTLGGGLLDSQEKLERKTREMELADVVIVPSHFVRRSVGEWDQGKKIIHAPFGSPVLIEDEAANIIKSKQQLNRPLRVMFAGSMGQRKGLGDLFSAIKLLKGANLELVVMGSLQEPINFYRNELPDFIYEPGRPHQQVLELMRTCDVFCLPSIVEGRALVMQEAMSQGLPLIITPNTGGEDLIVEGETGFLVPVGSPEKIAEKINWFLENRNAVDEMGKMAKIHSQKYTWENYGKQVIEGINTIFQ